MWRDDVLMHAVKKVRAAKHHIEEVYCPFPVHGLDKAMGLASTRIAITSFMYGCLGLAVAIVMMNYIMIQDWPQDPEIEKVSEPPGLHTDPDPAATGGPVDVDRRSEPDVVWLTAESLGDDDPALTANPRGGPDGRGR